MLYKDFVTHTIVTDSPSSSSNIQSPQSSSGTPYPIAHYINCDKFTLHYRSFIAAVTLGVEPKSFKEAMSQKGWRESMQQEIKALEKNGTWTMEELPPGKKALGCQWVY